jgi:hypothetical protein
MVVRLETLTLLAEPRNPGIAVASREQLRIAESRLFQPSFLKYSRNAKALETLDISRY